MGSICHIWEPQDWKIKLQGKSNFIKDDIVYQMIIGECDDCPGIYDITTFISKDNYEKIINKEYRVIKQPYSEEPIILYNELNNQIPLVQGNEKQKIKVLSKTQ